MISLSSSLVQSFPFGFGQSPLFLLLGLAKSKGKEIKIVTKATTSPSERFSMSD